MRRFHFKFKSRSRMFLVLLVIMIGSICGISLWTSRSWPGFVRKQNRMFSILEMMGPSDVFEVVKPNISTILMEPRNPFVESTNISEVKGRRRRPFAVIVVTSMASYFNQRQVIRSTWYKWASHLNIRIFFMIGFHKEGEEVIKVLGEEQRRYNDLIVDDHEEGYYRLPGKILRMLKWFNSTYKDETGPRFLIKTDHDVFLNLPNIVGVLKESPYYKNLVSHTEDCKDELSIRENESNLINGSYCPVPDDINLALDPSNPETYFIGGRKRENVEMDKDPDSKWYIDPSERERLDWSSTSYPAFVNGPCYVMSGNVVGYIYGASFSVPIYPLEDVYIVGLIASDKLNLHISNMSGMHLDLYGDLGFGVYTSLVKTHSRLAKLLVLHPADSPPTMWKLCKRISSCSILTNSAEGRLKVNLVLVLLVFYHSLKPCFEYS